MDSKKYTPELNTMVRTISHVISTFFPLFLLKMMIRSLTWESPLQRYISESRYNHTNGQTKHLLLKTSSKSAHDLTPPYTLDVEDLATTSQYLSNATSQ